MTPEERQQRIREVADRLAERLAEAWPEGDVHINDLEAFAERMGRDVQRELSERVLREHAEHKEGNQTSCPCGGVATYRRHHALTVVTAAGRLRLRRAYFSCRTCGKGQCPADARLGLGPANTTPTAQARLAVLGAFSPLVQVADLAAQLGLPLQLDLKSTERVAQGGRHPPAGGGALPVRPHRAAGGAGRGRDHAAYLGREQRDPLRGDL